MNISLRRKVGTVMATKEQMEKVKDIVVKLRYLECMDNIIYYDRWSRVVGAIWPPVIP